MLMQAQKHRRGHMYRPPYTWLAALSVGVALIAIVIYMFMPIGSAPISQQYNGSQWRAIVERNASNASLQRQSGFCLSGPNILCGVSEPVPGQIDVRLSQHTGSDWSSLTLTLLPSVRRQPYTYSVSLPHGLYDGATAYLGFALGNFTTASNGAISGFMLISYTTASGRFSSGAYVYMDAR